MEKLVVFFEGIKKLDKSMTAGEIQFQSLYTKENLRKLLKNSYSTIEKDIQNIHKRMLKHLCPKEGLMQPTWDQLRQVLCSMMTSYEKIAIKIYPDETIDINPQSVDQICLGYK